MDKRTRVVGVEVYINISHSYSSDMIGYLQCPDGTQLRLFWIAEGGESNVNPVGWYPADFTPKDDLAGFIGVPTQGQWTIKFQDVSYEVAGTLNEWSLRITYDETVPNDGATWSQVKGTYR